MLFEVTSFRLIWSPRLSPKRKPWGCQYFWDIGHTRDTSKPTLEFQGASERNSANKIRTKTSTTGWLLKHYGHWKGYNNNSTYRSMVVVGNGLWITTMRASDKSLHSRPGSQVSGFQMYRMLRCFGNFCWYLAHPPNFFKLPFKVLLIHISHTVLPFLLDFVGHTIVASYIKVICIHWYYKKTTKTHHLPWMSSNNNNNNNNNNTVPSACRLPIWWNIFWGSLHSTDPKAMLGC